VLSSRRTKERKARLAEKLHAEDGERDWRIKMVSVICREEATVEACLLALLSEVAEDKEEKLTAIGKYGLSEFLWDAVARQYDYRSDSPTVLDFAIEVFLAAAPCGKQATLGKDARVFLGRWKDSNRYRSVFEQLSARLESDLSIKSALHGIDGYAELLDADAFEAIDQKIIVELRDGILGARMSYDALRKVVERRAGSYWYDRYASVYAALLAAKRLTETIQNLDIGFEGASEAVVRYTKTYWQVDQLYRHFHYHLRQSGQATLLDEVCDAVERHYTNDYLLRLGDRFQQKLDSTSKWPMENCPDQRRFYRDQVAPFLAKGNKLFVVISDALRYEVAEELH